MWTANDGIRLVVITNWSVNQGGSWCGGWIPGCTDLFRGIGTQLYSVCSFSKSFLNKKPIRPRKLDSVLLVTQCMQGWKWLTDRCSVFWCSAYYMLFLGTCIGFQRVSTPLLAAETQLKHSWNTKGLKIGKKSRLTTQHLERKIKRNKKQNLSLVLVVI